MMEGLLLLVGSAILAVALLICGVKKKRQRLVWGALAAEFLIGIWSLYRLFYLGYFISKAILLIPLISIVGLVLVFMKPGAFAPQTAPGAPNAAPIPAAPAVSIPTDEGEQVVLQRTVPPVLAYVLMVLGGLAALLFVGVFEGREMFLPILLGGLLLLAVGFVLKKFPTYLTVTTQRVYIRGALCVRQNLPLDEISSVGTVLFNTLRIGTSSGRILLAFVPGYVEVYDTITSLRRQVK